jgi:geranylgeranyl reductase family protein
MLEACDVVIAGGGPAGAACAWKLHRAGLDVVVLDQAAFPRDKVCAGWITPQVIDDLQLDLDDYRRGRTLQPFTAFRVGVIGQDASVDAIYQQPVSFGIRRCEFDHYLLQRAGARVRTGTPLSTIRREGSAWVVNDSLRTPMLVGAAGHFCPVARMLNGAVDDRPLVIAQEVEFPIHPHEVERWPVVPERPELYFSPDLEGYGWCLRKERHVNVGFGCLSRRKFPEARAAFVAFLRRIGRVPDEDSWRWRGHAYFLSAPARRRVVDAGVVLAGDAAGLAYPQSGEGIRPAIESGLLAASAIIEARGAYGRDVLAPYERKLLDRFGLGRPPLPLPNVPSSVTAAIGRWLLRRPSFVRQIVIDRWFLHSQVAPLAASFS